MRGAGGSLGTLRKSCWLEMPLDAPGPRSRKKKRLAGKVRLKRPLDAAAGKRGLERPLDAAGKRWTLQGGGWKGHWTLKGSAGRCREAWEAFEGGRRQSWNRKKQLVESTARRCSSAWARKRPLDAAGKRWTLQGSVGGLLQQGSVGWKGHWTLQGSAGRCRGGGWKGHWTLQGSAGRCREAWGAFEGGRRQSWNRKKQ